MRILWADDQSQVAQTLARLLAPLEPRVDFVDDGDGALRMLDAADYDVVLLDLRMPPGEWGGLYVLEVLRDREVRTPVLVLSGEGSQAETIQATRLGAKDYVTKELVDTELVDRVSHVLAEARAERDRFLLDEAPAPVSVPLGRLRSAVDAAGQLRGSVEFTESLLRFCVIVGLAECRAAGSKDVLVDVLGENATLLQRPSMGSFEQTRTALRNKVGEAVFFRALDAVLPRKFVDRATKIRNDLAHSTVPSMVKAEALLNELSDDLHAIRNRLWNMAAGSLRIAESMEYTRGNFAIHGYAISGHADSLSPADWASGTPVPTGHVLLTSGDSTLDLNPLMLARRALEPAAWQLLVFDGVDPKSSRRPARMRFLDLWSGERSTESSDDLDGALDEFAI